MSTHRDEPMTRPRSVATLVCWIVVVILLAACTTAAGGRGDQDASTDSSSGVASPAVASVARGPVEVENAEGAAVGYLRSTYGIDGCLAGASITLAVPPDQAEILDEQITAANVAAEGWLDEGTVWVGSGADAAAAFGADAAFEDHHGFWIVRQSETGPVAHELRRTDSASGKSTWRLVDQIRECASSDPASDDDEGSEWRPRRPRAEAIVK